MKQKIVLGFLMGLMIFLFGAIKFCKIENSDFKAENNNYQWVELAKVVDGDTIQVKINDETESVRLIGIDAPEIEEKTKEKGIESKNYLKKLLENKKIRLESDGTQDDRDVYNRLLRYVFLNDGTLVNKKMIENKMAKEYTFKTPYKYQREFKSLGK